MQVGLDAKRERAWARLSDDEQERARRIAGSAVSRPDVPPFAAARTAYEKVLHALVAAGEPLSPPEIAYLLIAWWGFNTDIASVRRRLALAVQQGEARSSGDDRYYSTTSGLEHLQQGEPQRLPRAPRPGAASERGPERERPRPPASRYLRDSGPPGQPGRRHDSAR